jgi:DNA-binding NarL/FixJ family response regulator
LRLVFSGGVYIPPEALAGAETREAKTAAQRSSKSPADCGLTERQMEVLALERIPVRFTHSLHGGRNSGIPSR